MSEHGLGMKIGDDSINAGLFKKILNQIPDHAILVESEKQGNRVKLKFKDTHDSYEIEIEDKDD